MPTTQTRKYAAGTTVTPARSREELDKILKKYGATGFGYAERDHAAAIMFEISGRTYRFMVKLPQIQEFRTNKQGYIQSEAAKKKAWEQAVRETWRALVASIKGKLVAVDSGIETFEQAFQPYTVIGNGQVVRDYYEAQLENMYRTGELPRMLPSGK